MHTPKKSNTFGFQNSTFKHSD